MSRNLLKNPNGDEDLEFWELTENGGSQWKVEDLPGDCGHDFTGQDGVSKYFATSFELCLKRQVINLLDEEYSAEVLDEQPLVNISDWYCARTDCGCTYQMAVKCVTLDPENDDCAWKEFSDYGPGLRFITFEHGGQDTNYWDGWFGVRVTASCVSIEN
uniref:Zgc:175088 n=1 Tax=Neogobius melanostomus TaxID=47308 RepID=A0A8C6SQN2_9GOBI